MITVENLTKSFDHAKTPALNNITCSIPNGCIYGMVGSNGAGKSTFLRLVTGIYKADSGKIEIDGIPIYEQPQAKEKFVFVPDELYFLPQANLDRMADLYQSSYPKFNRQRFAELVKLFGLPPKATINTFSKGMKRQATTILALCCMTDYLFFDETFDGLDPVMRNLVKKVVYSDVCERNATAVITSHSLRELEDTCDQLALLHKGGVVFESDIQNLKTSLFKVQIAFSKDYDKSLFQGLDMLECTKKGSVSNIIVRGDRIATETLLRSYQPILLEILPLSLEEVFMYEMEALGYNFNDVLL